MIDTWREFRRAGAVNVIPVSPVGHELRAIEKADRMIRKEYTIALNVKFEKDFADHYEGTDYGEGSRAGIDLLGQFYRRGLIDLGRYGKLRAKARAVERLARQMRLAEDYRNNGS